jgi:hypothetical protein
MEALIIENLWSCLALAFASGWTLATAFTVIVVANRETHRSNQMRQALERINQMGRNSHHQSI